MARDRGAPQLVVVAITPLGPPDPAIAIAASRAGGIGVLDLTAAAEPEAAAALGRLESLGQPGSWGVRLDALDERQVAAAGARSAAAGGWVLLDAAAGTESLHRAAGALRGAGARLALEAVDSDEAGLAEELGFGAVVARGSEAGGRVGEQTAFVLLQRLAEASPVPVWVHGGGGVHAAAACRAGGAAGVVLDAQLLLARESPAGDLARSALGRMDGTETATLGAELGEIWRVFARAGLRPVEELHRVARELAAEEAGPERLTRWRAEVRARAGHRDPESEVLIAGADAALAAPLAERYRTVGGIVTAVREGADEQVRAAARLRPLDEGTPLARSHGTRYPLAQGPMTRVSDRPEFAAAVADAGGLPFLALALMRGPEVRALLEATTERLRDRPWGVGILGFVPAELRQEQLEAILAQGPRHALIAGGRPDQARALEEAGVDTYLHVPSPGLLRLFLESGARRFVFEGLECGGHVGPLASFVLWSQMVDALLGALSDEELERCHVLLAGGVHDSRSAAMVATLAAPLAERGARVGALMGTAYLFTEEAVGSGAIVPGFQDQAMDCARTQLLETGPGHLTRCAATPFGETFERERRRLEEDGTPPEERRERLERLNLGRLRIAAKGVARNPRHADCGEEPRLVAVGKEDQRREGMYMLGQVAALREQPTTVERLHREVCSDGSDVLERRAYELRVAPASRRDRPSDVAIVGMGCVLPKAGSLAEYWRNVLDGVDAVTEIPADRWDWHRYFDPDRDARDAVYSKWGGFIDDVEFDPVRYGIPPSSLPSIEPLQLLTLEVVRAALEDAGYDARPFPRERTSVILGVGGGIADLGHRYAVRCGLPLVLDEVTSELLEGLPEWTEDSFAGILLNVAAGRVANRFDLGGVNYTVDAACASSLAAVQLGAQELEAGTSDMVIVGGGDTVQNPFGYMCFSATQALSPSGRCRPFDAAADGIAISEGVAVMVLKRLADAERDGDRVYAVIKAVGGSSDGRDKGLTAPRPEGQVRALHRAYAKAGFSPAGVELIEAHGTGTVAGDRAEVETLTKVFDAVGAPRRRCAIGSVKSMIGHTKCTAGVAGLAKAALALHHKVLPPTLHVEAPNPTADFPGSPFYVNGESRPWMHADEGPRRAGVSAFGFGGTNFHAVLEEYEGSPVEVDTASTSPDPPAELFLWAAADRDGLVKEIDPLLVALGDGASPRLCDLSLSLWRRARGRGGMRLAAVAGSPAELRTQLRRAREALLDTTAERLDDPCGAFFAERPLAAEGGVAFLFPGQGSQSCGMLGELALSFPEVRERFETADRVLAGRLPDRLSTLVFPPPAFDDDERAAHERALAATNVAQPALGAAGMATLGLMEGLGVRPDVVAGHSYGELVALCAAGVYAEETMYALSEARGRAILEAAEGADLGTMAAVAAGADAVEALLGDVPEVVVANANGPRQTVVSGPTRAVERAVALLRERGLGARRIPVACAFHSPLVAPARDRLARELQAVELGAPSLTAFSNTLAGPYPTDPAAASDLLARHLVEPVRFGDELRAMHDAGARVFVEVGPGAVLTGLVRQALEGLPHVALPTAAKGGAAYTQLLRTVGRLAAEGVSVDLDRLYRGRAVRELRLGHLVEDSRPPEMTPTTWLVNGGRAVPMAAAAGRRGPGADATAAPASSPPSTVRCRAAQEPPPERAVERRAVRDSPPERAMERRPPEVSPLAATAPAARSPAAASPNGSEPDRLPAGRRIERAFVPAAGNDGPDRVIARFQDVMEQFLETQRRVMTGYLTGGEPAAAGDGTMLVPISPAEAVTGDPGAPAGGDPLAAQEQADDGLAPRTAIEEGSPSVSESPPAQGPPSPRQTPSEGALQVLLDIVSERTGYPPEMLDPELDIEADLGIDSIKRTEIVAVLQRACLPNDEGAPEAIERLSAEKTLGGLAGATLELRQASEPAPGDDPARATEAITRGAAAPSEPTLADEPGLTSEPDPTSEPAPRHELGAVSSAEPDVPRVLLAPVAIPPPQGDISALAGATILVTDDDGGTAHALAGRLREAGADPVVVGWDGGGSTGAPGEYRVALDDEATVGRLVESIRRERGPIAGVVHLGPLADPAEADLAAGVRRDVRSLFLIARALAADFAEGGSPASSRWLFVATAMDGACGSAGGEGPAPPPSHAGVAGLVKALAAEWPWVRARVVDLEPGAAAEARAECLAAELTGDGPVEVGWRGDRRLGLEPRLAPLPDGAEAPAPLGPDDVVLVTGGARGITRQVVLELAERSGATFVLVGRAPAAEANEAVATPGLSEPRELRKALIESARAAGETPAPRRIEAQLAERLKACEIRSTLAAIERIGASGRYVQADVSDPAAMERLVAEVYECHGRIDGAVHGAGVIEDRLVADKTLESFERVLAVKVTGAEALARHLREESLRFLVFFSSIAGRFGNAGQCDYAAANEILNKLAVDLDRRWPGRVVAVNWGPWAGSGMVTPEVRRRFEERGVGLVGTAAGRRALIRELARGRKGEVQVVLGEGPWSRGGAGDLQPEAASEPAPAGDPASAEEPPPAEEAAPAGEAAAAGEPAPAAAPARISPLLARPRSTGEAGLEFALWLDPERDRFLDDHRLDGRPVLPAAVALELVAEAAAGVHPELEVIEIIDFRVQHGVVVDGGAREALVTAAPHPHPPGRKEPRRPAIATTIRAQDEAADGYCATVVLGAPQEPPLPGATRLAGAREPATSAAEAYRNVLFQGPTFHGVAAIKAIADDGIEATLRPSSPAEVAGRPGGWLIDPVVVDSAYQLAILWLRATAGTTPLPSRLARLRRFGPLAGEAIRCRLRARRLLGGHVLETGIELAGPEGRVLVEMEGMEFTCSQALNRLVPTGAAGV